MAVVYEGAFVLKQNHMDYTYY